MRFWIQSFLIGVSRVVVGFRSHDGHLVRVQEMYTADLPSVAPRNWDADVCVDFAFEFLECEFANPPTPPFSLHLAPLDIFRLDGYIALSALYYILREKLTRIGTPLGLKGVIRGGGLWRIRRQPGGRDVEVFRLAEHGHGQVLSDEFLEWRNSEAMKAIDQQAQQRALQAEKERQERQQEARAAGQQQPS